MTAHILTILIMTPIYLGWMVLFAWPLILAGYVFWTFLKVKLAVEKERIYLRRRNSEKEVFHLLKKQKQIFWPGIETSLELSCHNNTVVHWMTAMGVKDAEGLKNGKSLKHSTSFPDSYDLVTNLLDTNPKKDLNTSYREAADHLRRGGTYISLETSKDDHNLSEHLLAARNCGLSLVARSDQPITKYNLVNKESWLKSATRAATIMLVWERV